MKTYHFQTLLGTVYRRGNILYLPGGDTLLSPVGNRISQYDLKRNEVSTLSVESSHNYTAMDISPNGKILIAGNEIGEIHVISLVSFKMLHLIKTNDLPSVIRYSPNGKYFAVAKRNSVFIYEAPSASESFNPYYMKRVFHDATGNITCLDWSFDSKLIAIGSEDMSIRVYAFEKYVNFKHSSFTSHSDFIVNVFFESNSYDLTTISRNGQLCIWSCTGKPNEFVMQDSNIPQSASTNIEEDEMVSREEMMLKKKEFSRKRPQENEEEDEVSGTEIIRFKKEKRIFYSELFTKGEKRPDLTCVDYNKITKLLVTGFSNGSFFIHTLPNFNLVQSLNISEHNISAICLNQTGDWIAFGCPTLGQLLVWEWQSETYILKQQGHFDTMNVCDYSSDGRNIVTGGDDGKVKVWEARSSFCFVTFTEHTSSITGVCFTQNGNAVVSSSLDGTVRAFDLYRYRNFRTFTSPKPAQFSCVTVDSGKEFVAAGAFDVFDIFLWSMKTGKLLEVLSGHEAPVPAVAFNPSAGSTQLVSVSWDKTLRVWETVDTSGNREIVQLNSEGTCISYRPDGEEIAVGTLDGQITFINPKSAVPRGSIEGRNHLGSGRSDTDKITAKKSLEAKAFTTVAYSPDGNYLIAGGQSKNVCLYDATHQMLIMKYQITQNKSLDAMNEFVHHRVLSEFGNMNLMEERELDSDKLSLPGVRKGDLSSRSTKPEVRVSCLRFSPTGTQWTATTTEGLLLYISENSRIFMPLEAGEDVTPGNIKLALKNKQYDRALVLSVHLNLENFVREVFETIPIRHIHAVCTSIPPKCREPVLYFLAKELGKTKHFEFCLIWIETFLKIHLFNIKPHAQEFLSALNALEKNLTERHDDLISFSNHNKYLVEYLLNAGTLNSNGSRNMDQEETDNDIKDIPMFEHPDSDILTGTSDDEDDADDV